MGGRGSAGNSGNGRGNEFRVPELNGSEKQVQYARDILTKPYERMLSLAKSFETQAKGFDKASSDGKGGASERRQAAAYRESANRYAKEISSLPKNMKARDIIDKQFGIRQIANNIVAAEYEKRGFRKLDAQKI